MKEIKVLLNEVETVKRFNQVANNFSSDIDVFRDRYIIDAKSLMGLFVLDLSKPLNVRLISDDKDEIKQFDEVMKEFTIK
jgi:phosphotransferase system HPr-like phosphotransfer protein